MSTPIKIICTDFDGTVFAEFESRPIPNCLVQLIRDLRLDGAKWIINTGRDLSSLMEALARSHIPEQPDYLVIVEREIHIHTGSSYRSHKDWNEACVHDHNHLYRQVRPEVPGLTAWISSRFAATVYEDAFSPLCLIAESAPEADAIHEFLTDFARQIPSLSVVRNDVYMRFSHSAYNKGSALTEIAEMLRVDPGEVFVAGDHLNDLPMLERKRARWLVAPANAVPQVRAAVREQAGYISNASYGRGVTEGLRWCLRAAGR